MLNSVCGNVPLLRDEPFITIAFIRPGLLMDRWEGRAALELLPHSTSKLTFQWSYFICHPQALSWCITVWGSSMPCYFISAQQLTRHTGCSCTPLLQRPITSYFHLFFLGWDHHTFFLQVFTRSVKMPPPPSSFQVMNDRWPSHWQLGSWCHIITVSPFRQNYQITPVLKRPGRLTGQPTKETNIWKVRDRE